MSQQYPTVWIAGPTGNQGGALAKLLLELQWGVQAVVRDLKSPYAQALTAAGAKLTEGDWNNEEALRRSITGWTKLFLNLVSTIEDLDHERRQAAVIAKIAKEVGVKQVVYSTTLGLSLIKAEGPVADALLTTSPLYAFVHIKELIEDSIIEQKFYLYTSVQPGLLIANYLEPSINMFQELLTEGIWSTLMNPDARLGLIDHDDVAKVTIAILESPEKFNNRSIPVISEFLTQQEILDRLGSAMGKPGLKSSKLTDKEIVALDPFENPCLKGHKCFETIEALTNMEELQAIAHLTSFHEFLKREEARVKTF